MEAIREFLSIAYQTPTKLILTALASESLVPKMALFAVMGFVYPPSGFDFFNQYGEEFYDWVKELVKKPTELREEAYATVRKIRNPYHIEPPATY